MRVGDLGGGYEHLGFQGRVELESCRLGPGLGSGNWGLRVEP